MKRFIIATLLAASGFLAASSAQATLITYRGTLSGAAEVPAVVTAGTGSAVVVYDTVAHTLNISATFNGLTSTTTASHIHCCTARTFAGNAGVATEVPSFVGFPLGVTSGSYTNIHDLTLASSYNPAFVTANGGTLSGAEAALVAGLANGNAYLNIHTSAFPTGEIRAVLAPEPASMALLTVGLLGMGAVRKRLRG